MDNGEKKISNLFDGKIVFNIPEYQRAYAWGDIQLLDFIEDIKNQKTDRSYFFGTVLFEEKGRQNNYEIIDIVDGQQRITTIIIFMSVLINRLKELSSTECERDEIDLLYETYVKHRQQYKLRALEEDNDFFHTYILENDDGKDYIKTPSQKRLYKAKELFSREIMKIDKNELNEIKCKIDEGSRVLVYSVKDTAEATLIFETTNDRGKGLTNLEKIKSFTMYKSYVASTGTPEQLLNSIRNRFSEIYKEYEQYEDKIDEDSVLQYHYINHESWSSKEYQQYVSMVKDKINFFINRNEDSEAVKYIDKYTRELKETFYSTHDILKSKNEYLRDIFILNRTGNFLPLLVKTYKLDSTKEKDSFSKIARLLAIYSFRVYVVNQNRGNTGQSKLYAFARDFTGDYDSLENSLKNIILEYSNDKVFKSNLSDSYIYKWMSSSDLSFFFWKYENYLRSTKQPVSHPLTEEEFSSKNSRYEITIEHIASQNPKDSIVNNEEILPAIDDDFQENCLHSIGNLTIDPKSANSSKGNKNFGEKNDGYFKTAIFKTQNELESFLINNEWSKSSVEKRKRKLIKFALEYWKV